VVNCIESLVGQVAGEGRGRTESNLTGSAFPKNRAWNASKRGDETVVKFAANLRKMPNGGPIRALI
jgi:hypothetical protein